jgi:type III secretion system chaperone SycN
MWIDETIEDFGRTLRIPGLRLNNEGVVSLAFEKKGTLFLERAAEGIIIYLTKELSSPNTRILTKSLSMCHFREGLPFLVNAGLKGDNQLVFSARIPAREFSLPVLEKAVDLLSRLHEEISEENV